MRYLIGSGPMQTTAAFATLATGTTIKTLLQVKPLVYAKLIEWGISFDGSAAATPGKVELIDTGTVAATVTASVAADVTQLDAEAIQLNSLTNLLTLGTGATGYNASVEGSITAVRNLSGPQLIAPTSQYQIQYPLGREPILNPANYTRIRVTFGASINAYAYMMIEF